MSKLMPVLGVFGTVPFICAFDKVFTFGEKPLGEVGKARCHRAKAGT